MSSGFTARLESCCVTCPVKLFAGEAREKRAHVANKVTGKEAHLSSMAKEMFHVEGEPRFEWFHESRPRSLIYILVGAYSYRA